MTAGRHGARPLPAHRNGPRGLALAWPRRAAHAGMVRLVGIVAFAGACSRAESTPTPPTDTALAPPVEKVAPLPGEPPSCPESAGRAWLAPAAGPTGVPRVDRSTRRVVQTLADGTVLGLEFVGAHAFDLLDKLATEIADDAARRRVVCHVLNDAAERGVPVLRLWGSYKRVGSDDEVSASRRTLALVLDENARRKHPLRFIVTLQNHQAGYGAPDPSRSLDEQEGPWHSKTFYLAGGWERPGVGGMGDRIAGLAADPAMRSPHVLAWELVNELDTFRHVGGGRFLEPDAASLRDRFLVPAATRLAAAVPQPIMLGDIRGEREAYARWAKTVVTALPGAVRERLVWTSHVYVPMGEEPRAHMHKLEKDLALADEHRLPFVLGELGQHVPGATPSFCGSGVTHDLAPLFAAVEQRGIRSLLVWGEGRCGLDVGGRRITIGAGGDSAELAPDDAPTHALLRAVRERW